MHDKKQKIFIITGAPCTGKTTFGREMSAKFNIPFFSKDDFKEILFDDIGWKQDTAHSRKLSIASNNILLHCADRLVKSGGSFILESNFKEEHVSRIKTIARKNRYELVQLFFFASPEITANRMRKRWELGQRHSGHIDNLFLNKLAEELAKYEHPLKLGRNIIKINVDDFRKVDKKAIYDRL